MQFTSNTRKIFEVLKIKGCTRVVVGYFHDLLTFVVNFELMNWNTNEVTMVVVLRGN